jgi:hypothetical protein
MNANELLEGAKLVIVRLNYMLCQQQAEIEELKADNKKAYAYIARLANEIEKAQEK